MRIPLLTRRAEAPSSPQIRRSSLARQPERHEPRIEDPGLTKRSKREYRAILIRAAKKTRDDQITDVAAALAYYAFLAIPAVLLVSVGLFGLFADPQTVNSLMDELSGVVPADAINLVEDSLTRITQNKNGGLIMALLGLLLALWTVTGAMNALMRGLNVAYDRKETRGFVDQRLTALGMLACLLLAAGLSFGLLVLGPYVTDWIGSAVGIEPVIGWIWWTLQWPILIGGLLLAFGGLLYLGPNADLPKFRFITPGSVFAVVVWIAASGLFALYVSMFGSYNKAWGSLAAVIVMLIWLWLSALALLLGAEINAEAERELRAPAKG